MMSKYMQVIWLYLIGIAIIFTGVIMLANKGGPNSFIVMLIGLAVAAIGAAHGRRMRMLGQLDINQLMQEKGMQQEQPAEKEQAPAEEEAPAEEKQEVKASASQPQPEDQDYVPPQRPVNLGIKSKIDGIMGMIRRPPQEVVLEPEDIYNIEMEEIKKGKIAATKADVIMLVCPKCMAENEEQNYFCYKCGNKLRRKPVKEDKKSEIAVEPGTISVVDDKRVAKVMICPKCNVANKVGDKFCRNCGKKIRTEGSKRMPSPKAKDDLAELDSLLKGSKRKSRKRAGG